MAFFTYDLYEMVLTALLFAVGWHVFRSVKANLKKRNGKLNKLCEEDLTDDTQSRVQAQTPLSVDASIETDKVVFLPLSAEATASKCNDDDTSPARSEDSCDWPDIWTIEADQTPAYSARLAQAIEPDEGMFAWLQDETNTDEDASEGFGLRRGPSPEAAAAEDLNRTLDVALASGDATLADSVLSSGARLCDLGWIRKALSRMREANIRVMSQRAVELMQVFARENRADLAAVLWQDRAASCASAEDAAAAEPEVYSALLEACAACGDFEVASSLAERARWACPEALPGQQAMLSIARWLARRRAVGPAMQCYDGVRTARGGAVDVPTHRAVLKACVSSNDMIRADILFEDLLGSGATPDFAIFEAMIRGHKTAGRPEEAMSHFALMKKHGIQPTASIFDVVLTCCFWQDVPALVEQVLGEMEHAGVQPSSGTLAAVLRLYGQSCKIDKALEAFEELPRRTGLQVDSRAYTAMISTCLEASRLDLALDTFDRMVDAGCSAQARTYEKLIKACVSHGLAERAVGLVEEAYNLSPLEDEESESEADLSASEDAEGSAGSDDESSASTLSGHPLMQTSAPRQPAQPAPPRARLDGRCVEELLRFLGRRHESARLAVGLLRGLRRVGVEVPDTLAAALKAAAREKAKPSWTDQRRALHNSWRNMQQVAVSAA